MGSIQIGAFELHPSERMLMTEGKPVELGARAFDLLLVLVENHGRLVNKATLLDRVWPRLVVDENNLPTQIATLRRILGPAAIKTVPGFGYRLELSAEHGTSPDATPQPDKPPPAQSALTPRRTWPERLPSMIGRDDDVRAVHQALGRASLTTIVGGAGVGKTRLAQEVLSRETAGQPSAAVAWISLESIDNAQHVAPAIAMSLGLSLPEGRDQFIALRDALEEIPVLLIFDGIEHLAETLALPLAMLLSKTRGVRALVTSQVPLRIPGEIVYRLAALPVPATTTPEAEAVCYPAVALFAQRVAAADRRFELNATNTPLVAAICRHLDGNPLALELAAARVPALGLTTLLDHLHDRFRLLKHSGQVHDPRHGALHAAFEWSYSLLSPTEQHVFTRLGAFAGSFSLDAAARCVTDADLDSMEAIDLIARLVDRSLVTALPLDPPRYTLLETARYFARERLQADNELEAARGRMAATMLVVLDTAYQEYWSVDETLWVQRYTADLENTRAAIDWATEHDRALAIALYGAAWPLFMETELFSEARARYEQTVRLLIDSLPRARLGRFWEAVSTYDSSRQCDRARYAAELAAKMYDDTGDVRSRYYALMQLALNSRDDNEAARQAFMTAKQLESPAWPARLLTQGALTEGALLLSAGKFSEARTAYRRAVRLALSVSERLALGASISIVELDLACDEIPAALQLGRPLSMSLRSSGRRATRIELLAVIFRALLLANEFPEARDTGAELFDQALRLDPGKLFTVLDAMAFLACAEQRHQLAAQITCSADVAYQAHGQARRRPTDERMRRSVLETLDTELGSGWRTTAEGQLLDEPTACSLALGLEA